MNRDPSAQQASDQANVPTDQVAAGSTAPGSSSAAAESGRASSDRERKELLAEVLGETLSRQQEQPAELLAVLKRWSEARGSNPLQQADYPDLVRRVLKQRLGSRAERFPDRSIMEISDVLWNDPASRGRIDRLWQSLESSTT
ncbi:MAG: hypothetical protein AAGA03_14460 [Planctomycetota bacterium]